jgi:hypothetical protein
MNKIYTTIISIFVVSFAFGQKASFEHPVLPCNSTEIDKNQTFNSSNRSTPFWTEDFNGGLITNNGTWTTTSFWKYSYFTTSGAYSGGTNPFASTSASNGFMLFDSDSANADWSTSPPTMVASPVGYTGELISPVIDLTGKASALLTLEQDFRFCCSSTHIMHVSISIDGGTTWGNPYDLSFGVGANSPYSTDNGGYYTFVNISGEAANQSNVKLKFTWDGAGSGSSHYYWAIDDIGIELLPSDDVQNVSSWIFGESTNFAEYGRTPLSQADQNWVVGSQVSNIGGADQTNVNLNVDFGSFSASATYDEDNDGNADTLFADSTRIIQTIISPSLMAGIYQGTYTLTSDADQSGGNTFANNTLQRNFEITNGIYSLDGLGNHPSGTQSLESYGSYSWPADAADGLVVATHFPFQNTDTISSVTAIITSNTVEYGEAILYIIDSTEFINGMFGNAIYTSNIYTVTATDVANGFIQIPVDDGTGSLEIAPGSYYAALELYSGGSTFDIGIISDKTIAQPFWSSAIWYPGMQAYTNGVAFAIRLNLGVQSSVGITENISDISIFPNPSKGIVNIKIKNGVNNNIIIRDISGKKVQELNINSNSSIDLNKYGKGVYFFEINSNHNTVTKKITIQ